MTAIMRVALILLTASSLALLPGCWDNWFVKHKTLYVYVPEIMEQSVLDDGTVIEYVVCDECCDDPETATLEITGIPAKTVVFVNGERMPRGAERFQVPAVPSHITATRPGYVLTNSQGLTAVDLDCARVTRVNLVFDFIELPPAPN